MPARVLHVSDLHVGSNDRGRDDVEAAVRELVARTAPELVLATGDLTHRNRREQHERAAAFLRSLGPPVLAIPGNHDLPAFPPRRLAAPFAAFLSCWPETEPSYRSERVVACCLNSVRPWRYQRGALGPAQLERAGQVLAGAPAGALRVVALHHHLTGAPWRTGKRSIPARTRVLAALAAAGAELVVSGHLHQSVVVERRELLFAEGLPGVVLAVAPGLGRPRPTRHAEASGCHVYEAEAETLRVRTLAWTNGGFAEIAERCFPRAQPPLPSA